MRRSAEEKGWHTVLRLLVIMTAWVLLAGCAKETGEVESDADHFAYDSDLIVVGVSQVGSESVWRTANTASIQSAFTKEKGYFLIFDNARQKQENQIKALRSFISQDVDYIVLSPITEMGWETVLQEAKEAGIPVILIDRKADVQDPSLYVSWVGSDFYKEGQMAGEILAKTLNRLKRTEESVRIVVLKGTEGSTAAIGRTNGFSEIADAHDNWMILESVDGEFTTAKGKEEMAKLLEQYEDIDVVIAQNDDMAFGALAAIWEDGRSAGEGQDEIMLISFDATRNALKLVDQGAIAADVECNPNQGKYAEEVIRKLESGEVPEKQYVMPEKVYTRYNAGRVLEERTY